MSDIALEVTNLCKAFGGLQVTCDVSLKVRPGERHLILGPNGAGKTTLFNLITGDFPPSSGQIRVFGTEVSRLKPWHRAHLGMSRTYQILALFPQNTLAHNVMLSLSGLSPSRWNPFNTFARQTKLRDEALRVLAQVSLGARADKPVSACSYGEKRRLEIALALAQKPKILLLDEPLAGLSQEERVGVQRLLEAIPRDITVVMIEHDMDVALSFAEYITVLNYGKVVATGTRAEVVANPKTREVYLGE